MLRNVASRVAWLGRTASMVFGLALILALVIGVATVALAAVPGDPFKLGQVNRINDAVTTLIGSRSGAMMTIDNDSPANYARALDLRVEAGRVPLSVNSDRMINNLNADELDGQEASDLAEPRGYAHIADEGAVDPAYPSKGVNGVVIPTGETGLYCFDLAFTPKIAVGSPFFFNNAVVATVTPPNTQLSSLCPATHRDAAAQTFAANTSADVAVNFQIVFE